jgi:hypothetical protein
VVSGNPDTFTVVNTQPDKSWDYSWYTSGLRLDAGSYTLYAASKPKTEDQLAGTPYDATSIIIKKPFITSGISPSSVSKGQPFTVTGIAEGNPLAVQIWIFGDNYSFVTTTPVNPDGSYTFTANATLSGELPTGQDYLIVQHPMENTTLDIYVSGDYVRSLQLNNGTNLFRISGPGSLQGNDAAEALVAAFSAPGNGDDTYTEIQFPVTDAGILTPPVTSVTTVPVRQTTQPQVPLQYAVPVGAGALVVVGIVLWKRH